MSELENLGRPRPVLHHEIIKHLLDYMRDRYITTLKTTLEIGDFTMDDAYTLLKQSHNELKELIQLCAIPHHQKIE